MKNKRWLWFLPVIVPGALALIAGLLVLALFLIKLVWAWTIPDLFPGAVQQGLVAAEITWWTAFKLAIFVAVVVGIAGARK